MIQDIRAIGPGDSEDEEGDDEFDDEDGEDHERDDGS